ncbi:MAG: 6-pyruvoyl tetrahydrobiopterin synthase [Candidatus Cloacimonadota bacterium]|nr:MAG: 6-pyruvoyl tetrahydrobiopterin synthase [Candidatus Cloacimonadota bacterium]
MLDQKVFLSRKIFFCSGHRYHINEWSDEKNKEVFGPCNNPHGHGHNYELEVTVYGPIDKKTGMVINLTDLDAILKTSIMKPLDHRFLNYEVDYFKKIVPTTENITVFCFLEIQKLIPNGIDLYRVKLYESKDLFVEYYGENHDFKNKNL